MKKNLVRDWMTPNPMTVDPKTTLRRAHQLMITFRIRRLPVVDRGRLVGIVTFGDLRGAEASDVSLLSQFELNDLIARLTVEKIMTWEPITASPQMTIQQAAKLMLIHKIAGLPVVEDDQVIGIITESDIFRVLVQESEYAQPLQKVTA